MICANGEKVTPVGETGIFFICQVGEHKGNHCRFVKLCKELNEFIMSTDRNGMTCKDYITK